MIKWSLRVFFVCTGLVSALALWFLLSTSGLQILFNQLANRVAGLKIENVEGRLVGPIQIDGVVYTAENNSKVELQTLQLDWQPRKLWSGTFKVTELSLSGLIITPGSEAAQEPGTSELELPDLELPINIEIDKIDFIQIRIADTQVNSITGEASYIKGNLSLRKLHVDAPQGSAALNADVQTSGKYPLQADADAKLKTPSSQTIHLRATVTGDTEQLNLESNIEDHVRLAGELRDLLTNPGWNANLHVKDLSPNRWDPGLPPGSLNGTLESQGDLQRAHVNGALSAIGTQLGDIELNLVASGNERSIDLEQLKLSHRDIPGQVNATGKLDFGDTVGYRFDAGWQDLKWLGAQGNGTLKLVGNPDHLKADLIAGFKNAMSESGLETAPILGHLEISNIQSKQPRIVLEAKADQLAYANYRLAELTAKADVDLADQQSSSLEIRSEKIALGERSYQDLLITASGTTIKHQINAQVSHASAILQAALAGGVLENHWAGSLGQLQLAGGRFGQWALEQPAALRLSEQKVSLDQACLKSGVAEDRVCVSGAWDNQSGWRFATDTEKLNPSPFLSLWRPDIKWDGDLSIQAELEGGAAPMSGNVRLQSACCGFTLTHDGEDTHAEYRDLSFDTKLSNGNIDGVLKAQLPDQGALSASLKMRGPPELPWQERQVDASAQLQLNSLRLLQGLSPQFNVQRGSGNLDVELSGTIADPKLTGSLGVQDLVVDVPMAGITLRELNVSVRADTPKQLNIDSSARVENGVIRGAGVVAFGEPFGYRGNLRITGDKVESVDLPQARILTSPDINIELKANGVIVDGSIMIDAADIDLDKATGSDVVISDDVVIVAKTKSAEPTVTESKVRASVVTKLGEATKFQGYGLSAKLRGELEVIQESGKPTSARGEIQIVDGSYVLYGQRLEVETGRLVFAGGRIDDPGLDLRVVRKVGEVKAGARVRGTAQTPQLTLFSEPQMTDTEILSYLVLGHAPRSGHGSQDAALLFAAAQSLLPGKAGNVTGKLKSELGLEQLSLDSTDDGNGRALVIGKYLSPRLYISYAAGLADVANVFRARYQLAKNWLLETESSAEKSGGSILYKIER